VSLRDQVDELSIQRSLAQLSMVTRDVLLQTGPDWTSYDEVRAAVAVRVPPGPALRDYETRSEQSRNRATTDRRLPTFSLEEQIKSGQHRLASMSLKRLVTSGALEERKYPTREIRLTPRGARMAEALRGDPAPPVSESSDGESEPSNLGPRPSPPVPRPGPPLATSEPSPGLSELVSALRTELAELQTQVWQLTSCGWVWRRDGGISPKPCADRVRYQGVRALGDPPILLCLHHSRVATQVGFQILPFQHPRRNWGVETVPIPSGELRGSPGG
jgi:hypothetical protein